MLGAPKKAARAAFSFSLDNNQDLCPVRAIALFHRESCCSRVKLLLVFLASLNSSDSDSVDDIVN